MTWTCVIAIWLALTISFFLGFMVGTLWKAR